MKTALVVIGVVALLVAFLAAARAECHQVCTQYGNRIECRQVCTGWPGTGANDNR